MASIRASEQPLLYENELFVDQITEEYKCSICLTILQDPQQLSVCEHLFCRHCITTYFQSLPQNNFCPLDRRPATLADMSPAHRSIANIIDRLQVRCHHHCDGCTAVMPLDQLGRHGVLCRFGPFLPTGGQSSANSVVVEVSALPMTVIVKLADGSKTVVISASSEDNVLTLKRRIYDKEGIDPQNLILTHGTKPLDNDQRLLVDYNIKNGSIVFSTRRFLGGID